MVNLVFNLQKCYGDKVNMMLNSFCVAQLIFSAMHQLCVKHLENLSSQQVPLYSGWFLIIKKYFNLVCDYEGISRSQQAWWFLVVSLPLR